MTNASTLHFRSVLEAKRQELVRAIQAHTSELSIHDGEHDPIDQVQGMSRRDEAAAMVLRLSRTLSEVDKSLRAIAEGLYGVCAECEDLIDAKRLNTIPWASYCVSCQKALERGEAIRAPEHRFLVLDRDAA
jgi:RNA polymerase-binding protein DksA